MGASAGGLQALSDFFATVPQDCDYSFIIVQHLSPNYESFTDELLGKKTSVQIDTVKDGVVLEKNRIYVIPSNKNLILKGAKMILQDKPKGRILNLPIDILFESLAENFEQNAVAVVLSGTGSDGSKGIQSIKAHGGMIMVQQPDQAKFPAMPENAINTNMVDYILPVEEMMTEMQIFFQSPDIVELSNKILNYDELSMNKILNLIQEETDLDFNQYKKPTLLRRMSRRIKILQLDSFSAYHEYLRENPQEVIKLYKDFLIGVTHFFRDSAAWDVLRKHVIPELVKFKGDEGELKIWDVGCNTGEEAYTLGMLFLEECKKQEKKIKLKIFATDISKENLDVASKGVFKLNTVANIDHKYLSSYFTKQHDDNYKVVDKLRRAVLFTEHNILQDPPFSNVDLCVCRNLLIYLQNPVQKSVLKVLHYSLKVDSFLMLGPSENLGSEEAYYEDISRKWKIYRNIKTTKRSRNRSLSASTSFSNYKEPKKTSKNVELQGVRFKERRRIDETVSSAILRQFNATTIQVDTEFRIIEARGNLKSFVNLPEEGFSYNLLEILPEKLNIPIKTSVKKAKNANSQVIYEKVLVDKNGDSMLVDIMVLPALIDNDDHGETYMVTLLSRDKTEITNSIRESSSMSATAALRIRDLEEELDITKEELSKALQDTEASNEELQASNEELLASNEELQSTNEELQSVNEELHTVNNEHLQKMEELANLNADMDNLLKSTKIGVIYLDKDFRIRKFTSAIKEHFNLLRQDIGRHIDNFMVNIKKTSRDDLVSLAKEVMETGVSIDRNVISKQQRHFLMRITPFTGRSSEIEGVVIAFTDVEVIHESRVLLQKSEKKFKDFYESDPIMHASINPNTGILVECNTKFHKALGYAKKSSVIGKPVFDFYSEESRIKASKLLETLSKNKEISNQEMVLITKGGKELPVLLNSNIKQDEEGNYYTRSTLMDLTEIKKIRHELEIQKKELENANIELEQFVSICSHDLQEPLSTIKFGSEILKKKYSEQFSGKASEYLEYINQSSTRLSEQIKALLEHSKLGQTDDFENVDIGEVLKLVKEDLASRIESTNTKITTSKLPEVFGYKTELRLLFQNLIGNAIKYKHKDRSPEIRISAFKDDHYYHFSVSDNGIGIKEEDLENIFKIFSRVEKDNTGTGVGLAHAKKIVKLHNGKIWVDSEYGKGSTFHFKLMQRQD
ncbi:PAS domain S-box protein [Christiangramia sabulilitoris]|uniref:PAS domain S-box protein n=2 Tax=Christiangramia sabulilitoris TaxID=2583991 RepID=A0A550HXA0_9FLAO|nr:PAS domain S-box protein [Christiangramia sabulilitoris]